jgi:hypothetical protein
MKIGAYELRTVKRGFEETNIGVPEGDVYYVVQLDKTGQMDVKTQIEAEVLSRLVRIENELIIRKKKSGKENNK